MNRAMRRSSKVKKCSGHECGYYMGDSFVVANCDDCGWEGPERTTPNDAIDDMRLHFASKGMDWNGNDLNARMMETMSSRLGLGD